MKNSKNPENWSQNALTTIIDQTSTAASSAAKSPQAKNVSKNTNLQSLMRVK